MALKSMPAKEARDKFSDLLDDAEDGRATVIYRNSKPTAAVIPSQLADLLPVVQAILCESRLNFPTILKCSLRTSAVRPSSSGDRSFGTRCDGSWPSRVVETLALLKPSAPSHSHRR